jgi:hypothetical protein
VTCGNTAIKVEPHLAGQLCRGLSCFMPTRLVELDQAVRHAVHEDRAALCDGHQEVRKRDRDARYGEYSGGYLSLPHLAELVAEKMYEWSSWTAWPPHAVESALRVKKTRPDKALPDDPDERQMFLEALQRILDECFDKARLPRRPHSYELYLGSPTQVAKFREFDWDPSSIGFYRITEWNASRRLDRDHVGSVQTETNPAPQDWVDQSLLDSYLDAARARRPGSICPTLVRYQEDTREAQGQELILWVAESRYCHNVAIGNLLKERHDLYDKLVARLSSNEKKGEGLDWLIEHSPRSNIAINVTVSSNDNHVMLIRRPRSATTWADVFQVGPHETMNWAEPGKEYKENCFELAHRALWEEVRLRPNDLVGGEVVFSWFGYYLREAQAYFFAHAKTGLTRNELIRRAEKAQSAFEIADIEWIELTKSNVRDVINSWYSPWEHAPDRNGRNYLPHAAVSLTQLFRVTRQGMIN